MSVASEIARIKDNIAAVYDEAEAKGATMPATENSANLAETVASIPTGTAPTLITKQIAENGTYTAAQDGADGYSEVTVDIQPYYSSQGTMYFADMVIPDTVTKIKPNAYLICTNMQTLEIAGTVKTVGADAFQNCPITRLVLNDGIENIQSAAFLYHNCSVISIPASIVSIDSYSFSSGFGFYKIDLSSFTDPNSIPTLKNANAFNSLYAKEFLAANQQMLEAFETATNWSTYAGKYVIKGAVS